MMKQRYERPRVRTLRADQIVEMMGPVSCGSNMHLNPVEGGLGIAPKASGFSDLSE